MMYLYLLSTVLILNCYGAPIEHQEFVPASLVPRLLNNLWLNQGSQNQWTLKMNDYCLISINSPQAFPDARSFLESPAFISSLYQAAGLITSTNNMCQRIKSKREEFSSQTLKRDSYMTKYILRALNSWQGPENLPSSDGKPLIVQQTCSRGQQVCASIAPFKLGELDRKCSNDELQKYIQQGIRCFAIYPVAHLLGDTTSNFIDPNADYSDIVATQISFNAPESNELKRCIKRLAAAGMAMSIMPHYEYIETMADNDEARWRIAMIPKVLDTYDIFYKPVFDALKEDGLASKVPRLTMSIAAEIDVAFVSRAQDFEQLYLKIKNDAGALNLGSKFKITLDPNGDSAYGRFVAALSQEQCKTVTDFLLNYGASMPIGPSIYDIYQQVAPPGKLKPSVKETTKMFVSNWFEPIDSFCSGNAHYQKYKEQLKGIFDRNFYFGEFSLNGLGRNTFFPDVLVQIFEQGMQVNIWTTGQPDFDPFVAHDFPMSKMKTLLCS
ncbi:hypothetical protein MP638_000455 [Amoeboaphelidium occidentale]|nr:hypothetical protein MP638_000455 [Amoeboaphelidium occidentale]